MLELIGTTFSQTVVIQSVLMGATAAAGPLTVATTADQVCCVEHGSVARPVNHILTRPTHHHVDTAARMVGSSIMAEREGEARVLEADWAEYATRAPEWAAALRRLDQAGSFDDGWDGVGSLQADRGALMGAKALLLDLEQEISADAAPKVGLDSDGVPTLSWCRGDLAGSLSVFDSETYGYYIERGAKRTAMEEAKLSEPIPQELLDILGAQRKNLSGFG